MGDVGVLAGTAVAGLGSWFVYVAVQPFDYRRVDGSRLDTFFGWRAPFIDPSDVIERDRMAVAFALWAVIGFVVGRLRPRLWPWVGAAVVAPTITVFWSTCPRDAQGWWHLDVFFLPFVGAGVSGVAVVASRLGGYARKPLLVAAGVGGLFAVALLSGGGESKALVVLTGVATGVLGAAAVLALNVLAPTPAASGPKANWYPDPGGRHQYRYWNGSDWSEHVSDDGVARVELPHAPMLPPTI